MSSVLFDNPGPRTRARHRLYSLITALVMLGLVGLVLWQFGRTGQLSYSLWEPFVTPAGSGPRTGPSVLPAGSAVREPDPTCRRTRRRP